MIKTLYRKELEFFRDRDYQFLYWKDFDFSIFKHIYIREKGNKKKTSYADLIIMADTETSRKPDPTTEENHICAWSIAFRAFGFNICTLWGQNPREFCDMLENLRKQLTCDHVYVYFHNLPYDWIFLRQFLFEKFGKPINQLNIKPLYPIFMQFSNGLWFKDSLILAQRNLDKWAKDMKVEHTKALGAWDYTKYRNQSDELSDDELLYIEHDVLAGVECLDATLHAIKKTIGTIPYTATGIVRTECRNEGRKNKAHDWFLRVQPDDYKIQQLLELLFTGGYTHGNRNAISFIFPGECEDIASSYPFINLTEKVPAEQFWKLKKKIDAAYLLKNSDNYAFIFKLKAKKVKLRNKYYPMPYLSKDKAQLLVNPICDNGRVLSASEVEIIYNEIDLEIFIYQYKWEGELEISDVYAAYKDYLPRWLTDYVYKRFELKTKLKGVDPVLYQIEKGKLNACSYGMLAMHPVKINIVEDYDTGEYKEEENFNAESEYKKYLNKRSSFLPYPVAPWITSAARRQLFKIGTCVATKGLWLYSDTDSVYATKFNKKKIARFNRECIEKLKARGYDGIEYNGKIYYPGVLEDDGQYMQFKTLHSKCYAKRPLTAIGDNFIMGEDLQITVAGVPKKGAASLENNLNNFKVGFIFDGKTSGKLQHKHNFINKIYVDEWGNLTGDSIDLSPANYQIKDSNIPDFEGFEYEDIEVQIYEEE